MDRYKQDIEPILISAEKLAAKLDVTARTIREWEKEGRIPSIRISRGCIRFSVDEVMKSFEARRANGKSALG